MGRGRDACLNILGLMDGTGRVGLPEIRQAFLLQAKRWHPDKLPYTEGGASDAEKFRAVHMAYSELVRGQEEESGAEWPCGESEADHPTLDTEARCSSYQTGPELRVVVREVLRLVRGLADW